MRGCGDRASVRKSFLLDGPLRAPVRAGDRAGELVFTVNGEEVGRVTLLCGADVAPLMESVLSVLKQGLPG